MKTNHSLHAILLLLLGLLTVLLTASPGTAAAPAVLCVRVDGKSNTIAVSYSEPVSLGGVYTLDGGASIGGRRTE